MTGTVHWLGAGLSSGPGIRRLAGSGRPFVLWNRTVEKARQTLGSGGGPEAEVRSFSMEVLREALRPGDIVVSMVTAHLHPSIARVCLERGAHLVTSSYLSEEMKGLDGEARRMGLSLVNECGVDPGLDHLMARDLLARCRGSGVLGAGVSFSFRSCCGGFPRHPGPFRYKFSWSPLAVLRALKSPARYIRDGRIRENPRPWTDLSPLSWRGEMLEIYPNRDSTGYLREYGFDPAWKADEFIRATIRPQGWASAWKEVFDRLEGASAEELERLSGELWSRHQYAEGEEDRVILAVSLEMRREGQIVWSGGLGLDEYGSGSDSAMARTVSIPTSLEVESVLEGRAPLGVSGSPTEVQEIRRWFAELEKAGIGIFKS
jgi:saccharopine dehydrogenase (NADP+, L-glutamate forming)